MLPFSRLCEAIAATPAKNEKVRLVADYLRASSIDEAALAVLYLSGHAFPRRDERVLSIGFSLLLRAVVNVSGKSATELAPVLRHHGDLGAGAEEALQQKSASATLRLADVATIFAQLAVQRGIAPRERILEQTLRQLSPLEAKYFIRVATGELRIGLKESLVEEAISAAYGQALKSVQHANMLTGDISETLRAAARNALGEIRLQLFRPVSAMLASPAENAQELAESFRGGALVEDKFDGIRAQIHKSGAQVEIYSRTLDRVTEFPEISAAAKELPGDFILDGEIIGWRDGRAVPFTELQQRLGRKQIHLFTRSSLPVSFVAFDLLLLNGRELLHLPLSERRVQLATLFANIGSADLQFTLAELRHSPEQIEAAFSEALRRGNEGLIAKAPESPYVPGRRGRFWIKLKRPLATLDVVVTAAEYGHGKRRGLLSDYTFAVRKGETLLNIGKAYSGVTDAEIRQLTEFFLAHTVQDHGHVRSVEPRIVMEVAFNNIQRSDRHNSGYALRFPRILRLRPDKPVAEIDTIDRVREIFEAQHAPKQNSQ